MVVWNSFCYPYPWEYDSHLTDVFQMGWKHQLEQVMEVFRSILYWIPKKFHNNHVLEQINSFQTCQPSGVFFICNFGASGIYLVRPIFSGCVVPFKKGDMKTSPVVVDQPRESWNVSTQGQVRSVASTFLGCSWKFGGIKAWRKILKFVI